MHDHHAFEEDSDWYFNWMHSPDEEFPEWEEVTRRCAEHAHDQLFESKTGILVIPGYSRHLLCVFNNNPYVNYPRLRDEEFVRLQTRLTEIGIQTWGVKTFPVSGDGEGYSCAMVVNMAPDRQSQLEEILHQVELESLKIMQQTPPEQDYAGEQKEELKERMKNYVERKTNRP